jgi:predicted amidohydrolase YtcJ
LWTRGAITAVGTRESVKVPPGAQVIDGRGKTLLPGLWDSHMHVGDDYTGLQELSLGVTSVRDPGNDNLRTLERRKRGAAEVEVASRSPAGFVAWACRDRWRDRVGGIGPEDS